MSLQVTGEVTILKYDKGICKVSLANKEIDENGEEKTVFMQVNVGFRKGVEVKNKSKIKINESFLTFFRIKTNEINEETGKEIYKSFPKIMVLEFDVLEEGVDETFTRKAQNTEATNDQFGDFYGSDDELPF